MYWKISKKHNAKGNIKKNGLATRTLSRLGVDTSFKIQGGFEIKSKIR